MRGHGVDMARHPRGILARGLAWENAEDVEGQGEQDGTPRKGPIGFQDRVKSSGRGLATLSIAIW